MIAAWMALAVAYAGFAALGLAMDRHQPQLIGRTLAPRANRLCQLAGGLLLATSLALCMATWSTSVAIVGWLGLLTVAALALGVLLAFAPRVAGLLALAVLPMAAVMAAVMGLGAMARAMA